MILLSLIIKEETENSNDDILEKLLFKMAKGEKEAFEEFYKLTKASVYAFSLSILKSVPDAEDIAQTVYLNLFNNVRKYKSKGKPMAWMLTMVKNLCYDKIRKDSHTEQLQDFSDNKIEITTHSTVDNKVLAEACLNILPDEERNILILHIVSGLKRREISELLEIPMGTVATKYNRALEKIKKHMQGGVDFD
jgi:RNA polymerase sigma-70 factor (ECF subfamily)